jgi:hypothetical protein
MPDITMSLDDTLELDTIVKESTTATDQMTDIKYEGSDTDYYNNTGFQTHTAVFKPEKSGKYSLKINGQKLTIKVTDPTKIPASGLLYEGFEDGSLDSNYGGVTGSSSVQNSRVYNNDYSLEINDAKGSGIARTDITVERGQRVSGWVQAQSGGYNYRASMYWMAQSATSEPNSYIQRAGVTENEMNIWKIDDSGLSVLVEKNVSLSGDTWYECEFVPKSDGTEDWYLYNTNGDQIASATTSDGTYNSGGFGFRMGHGSDSAFHDDVRRWE